MLKLFMRRRRARKSSLSSIAMKLLDSRKLSRKIKAM
jgi:hypothetical protein